MADKIFVGRVTAEDMSGSNGPWVKTKISFNAEDLAKLAQYQNEKGYVNLNFNRSQKGSEYMEIDTWQPTQQAAPVQQQAQTPPVMPALGSVEDDGLPF
jgi:hypothetical protein